MDFGNLRALHHVVTIYTRNMSVKEGGRCMKPHNWSHTWVQDTTMERKVYAKGNTAHTMKEEVKREEETGSGTTHSNSVIAY